jgi:hypothetical protein
MAGLLSVATAAPAQPLPRSHLASPEVYAVIAENDQYLVIAATWKPGQKDKPHAHATSAVYVLTDCSLRYYSADGKVLAEGHPVAGRAVVQNPIAGHIVENIGNSDCKLIMFEPK